ncbi:MAG: type II toxin-antitoxin system antitoxin SocA domain-containing protein [Pseudomonadota bacterium]
MENDISTEERVKCLERDDLSPSQIANYFIAISRVDNIKLTTMKLIKLVYIAYGWCMVLLGRKIFSEEIEAWKFGPVIPSLYHEFKRFGPKPIQDMAIDVDFTNRDVGLNIPIVEDEDVIEVLGFVWSEYKNCDAFKLSDITHKKDSPWSKAYTKGQNAPLNDVDIYKRCLKKINDISDDI